MHTAAEANRIATQNNISATELSKESRTVGPGLTSEVYRELRSMARRHFIAERRDHTLQPTALVHETFLRLGNPEEQAGGDLSRYLGFASRTMRRILVEHARARTRQKRGRGYVRVSDVTAANLSLEVPPELEDLDEALQHLAHRDPRKAAVVELRFFGGLTIPETAEALGISEATVKRHWRFARAWLYRCLSHRKVEITAANR